MANRLPLLNATNYQPLSVWSAVAQLVRCSSLHWPLICKFQLFCLLSGFECLWISRFVLSNGKLDLLFQLADHFLQTKTVSTLLEKHPVWYVGASQENLKKNSSYNPKKMWATVVGSRMSGKDDSVPLRMRICRLGKQPSDTTATM